MKDCYKIKLRGARYRLVYRVEDERIVILVAFEATCTPVQLIKDLMETLGLTGSDLPEIGDKTAVSKVLNGDRPISHKMAYALAERFAMEPSAFLTATSAKVTAYRNWPSFR